MNITEEAQKELKKALDNFDKPEAGVHIYSTQGCCGSSIQIDIAAQAEQNETVISLEGINFFVPNNLLPQLENITIEYGWNGFRLKGLQKKCR